VVAFLVGVEGAGAAVPTAPDALPQLWAVQVDGKTLRAIDGRLVKRLRAARVALVASPKLGAAGQARLEQLARAGKLVAIRPHPVPPDQATAGALSSICHQLEARRRAARCGIRLPGRRTLARVAKSRAADLLVVNARAGSFAGLRGRARHARVLGVVELPGAKARRIRSAALTAARSTGVDLVVRPSGRRPARAIKAFIGLVGRVAGDRSPPAAPRGLHPTGKQQGSVSVDWRPAKRGGRNRFGLYRDGVLRAGSKRTSAVFRGLGCRAHTLAVDAVDRAGNRSRKSAISATPSCGGGDGLGTPSRRYPDEDLPPTRWIAAGGSDSGSCTQAAPCASFQRAYAVASPGEIVEVAAGQYPAQVFRAVGGKTGPNIIFRPAPGARPQVSSLSFGGSERSQGPQHITVRRMTTAYKTSEPGAGNQDGIWVGPGSAHITLQEMDAGSIDSWFADHLTVTGGDFGPCHAIWAANNVCGNSKQDASTNVLIDGATFHDYRFDESCFTGGADCHWECMYINAGVNVTVRNSKFRNCAIFDIFATISGPDAGAIGHRNLRIYNNWFATPWTETPQGGSASRPTALSLAWCQNSPHGYKDVFVGFNSFQRNTMLEVDSNPNCVFENVQVVGNLMMWDGCQPRWTYRFNVWSTAWRTGTCDPTDRIAGSNFPYVNGDGSAAMDYHVTGVSLLTELVPAAVGCPGEDVDGQARSQTGHCDAGSDER
jgi:hypothetical protein